MAGRRSKIAERWKEIDSEICKEVNAVKLKRLDKEQNGMSERDDSLTTKRRARRVGT